MDDETTPMTPEFDERKNTFKVLSYQGERSELQSQPDDRRAKRVERQPAPLSLNNHTLKTSESTQYAAAETPPLEQLRVSPNRRFSQLSCGARWCFPRC
jgi:hypothetical protein